MTEAKSSTYKQTKSLAAMQDLSADRQIELRSPEIQVIIGRVPDGILQWGIKVIFLVMVALLFISWFIRYPDLLPSKVTITTSPPPALLVARTSGRLILLKRQNEKVNEGELIAFIKSNASPEAVLVLERALKQEKDISCIDVLGSLGDLEPFGNDIVNAEAALQHFQVNKAYDVQIDQLTRQLLTYKRLSVSLWKQQNLAVQELVLAKEKYNTDSILFQQKVTARLDFNAAQSAWLQQQRNTRNAETALINNETQLNQLRKQIADLEIQKLEHGQKLNLATQQAKKNALAQIAKWKEDFLFAAPIAGTLTYLGFLENNEFIETGKPYFTVVPNEGQLLARAELPLKGSGKVKVGQPVKLWVGTTNGASITKSRPHQPFSSMASKCQRSLPLRI